MDNKKMKEVLPESLVNAKGNIPYTFKNDYMFRVVLQKNEKLLKAVVCAVLGICKEDVADIDILNQIELGTAIDDKTFILDIKVLLNNTTIINLEMQILNYGDWPERSLSYLARSYDNVAKGSAYIDVKPVYHIGFLDFTLFPDYPEFFAKYMLMNVRNHNIYTSKFNLYVIDLTKIDMATDEDEASGLKHWAQLFKATTWEELRQMAEKNRDYMEAAEALYEYNQDEVIREQCQAREDYYKREKVIAQKMEKMAAALIENAEALQEKDAVIEEKDAVIEKKDAALKQSNALLANSVKSLMEKLHISEAEACGIIGISIEEYHAL